MYIYLYIGIIGMCIASFMNVVIDRVPQKISVVKGRSYCPSCHHSLGVLDLIPVISYIFLRGKCRYCHCKLSIREPLIELMGGGIALLCYFHYGNCWMGIISFLFTMTLIALSMIDRDIMEIPDSLNAVILLMGLFSLLVMETKLLDRIIGCLVISVPLMILNVLIPNSFGDGDIKLLFGCGFLLGWQKTVGGMCIAIILAGIKAFYLLVFQKVNRKSHLPFAPYISIGMVFMLFYGEMIIGTYLKMFCR